ncbi:VWA domain-containing protein [uncultured Ornithinimicrobium sp.]|uniref:vWA domain-containing protein n=1 Tax=uncultured Ornithinimicrobium sp. TaxID=259307 RepID=UPI00338F5721
MRHPGTNGERRIDQLNAALSRLPDELARIPELSSGGEILAVRFGVNDVKEYETVHLGTHPEGTETGFMPVNGASFATKLPGDGPTTPMGAGLNDVLRQIRTREDELRRAGFGLRYRTLVFLLTDGGPTDNYRSVLPQLRQLEEEKRLLIIALGVHQADRRTLQRISPSGTLVLEGMSIAEAVRLVSVSAAASISESSQSSDVLYKRINEAVDRRVAFMKRVKQHAESR